MRRLAPVRWALPVLLAAPVEAAAPAVRFVDFATTVNPVTALRITAAIDDAEREGDELVLIQLDTPGGFVDSMEPIVKRLLSAEVPVVVWVGPSGARAASAGFFVLIAADLAAMAPGTRTGAASTVMIGGENRADDVLLKKSNEDLAALVRSIAERRGRNVAAAERAVFEAKAYEERVAQEEGLIDLVADSRDALLRALDGREVRRFDGTTAVLHTAGARLVQSSFPLRQRFMELLAQPWLAFLLLLGGLAGLYVEFTHPGVVFPGVAGALCLLLFFLSAQVLPISAIGVLLVLLAIVMFILEVKVTSYGMLTVGGIVSLIIGSLILVEGPIPELRVPLGLVLPASLTMGLLCALAMALALRAQRAPVATGIEGLVGRVGSVTRELAPAGKVLVMGELWNALSTGPSIAPGARVRVVRVHGLELTVEPLAAGGEEPT
jgi:membrane-bound serine protease (ClpP class)